MPIRNRDDAVEVESRIARIFDAPSDERGAAVRGLFVEVLDFDPASGYVDLGAAPANVALPASAERVASLGGVHVEREIDRLVYDLYVLTAAEVTAVGRWIVNMAMRTPWTPF